MQTGANQGHTSLAPVTVLSRSIGYFKLRHGRPLLYLSQTWLGPHHPNRYGPSRPDLYGL